MSTHCPTCRLAITKNERVEIRGALAYHLDCAPSSLGAPTTIWQAFLALIGCRL